MPLQSDGVSLTLLTAGCDHTGCWMGWPDSPYLWRENAKPAQEQYAAIATQISEFEPVTMMANPEASPPNSFYTGKMQFHPTFTRLENWTIHHASAVCPFLVKSCFVACCVHSHLGTRSCPTGKASPANPSHPCTHEQCLAGTACLAPMTLPCGMQCSHEGHCWQESKGVVSMKHFCIQSTTIHECCGFKVNTSPVQLPEA